MNEQQSEICWAVVREMAGRTQDVNLSVKALVDGAREILDCDLALGDAWAWIQIVADEPPMRWH